MTSPALALKRAIEGFHSVCYFAPEVARPYRDAGLHPWNAYFAQRAAPLGAISAATVSATFYNFGPRLVARSIPSVWEHITPDQATGLRVDGTLQALHRLVADVPDRDRLLGVRDLIRSVNRSLDFAGRPLAAAHAAIDPADDPLGSLWWETAVLREYRGDGHVAVLVAEGVGPVEALVTASGYGDLPVETYRRNRGWSEEEWTAGIERCRVEGWVDSHGALTEHGRSLRDRIESATDATVGTAMRMFGDDIDDVIDLIKPISRTIYERGGVGEKQN